MFLTQEQLKEIAEYRENLHKNVPESPPATVQLSSNFKYQVVTYKEFLYYLITLQEHNKFLFVPNPNQLQRTLKSNDSISYIYTKTDNIQYHTLREKVTYHIAVVQQPFPNSHIVKPIKQI